MSPLERLGLEVCATHLLGSPANAKLLCALIAGGGAAVSNQRLANARKWRLNDDPGPADLSAKVGVCLLREKMADVGLPGLIVTHSKSYALPEPGRTAVIARLIEEAETC